MNLKILLKEDWYAWVESICKDYRVYGPMAINGEHTFEEIDSANGLAIDYSISILPLKKVINPQKEDLLSFDIDKESIEPIYDIQPTVVLGAHTCDLYSIVSLDSAFLLGDLDQHYFSRRENTIFVSFECLNPCSGHSFCNDMGTSSHPEEYDFHLTDLYGAYAINVGSEKGKRLIRDFDAIRDAGEDDYRLLNKVLLDKRQRFPLRLQVASDKLPSLFSLNYQSELWDEIGDTCLGCGICTIVCPTCYCFNVLDEVDFSLGSGKRYRVWDSCQLNEFALIAGGVDFRASQTERQRHRFYRKYMYQTEAYGIVGCVGCGRCSKDCIVDISPIEVINQLYSRNGFARVNREEVTEL
ncbi:MAG: 4Fe-4S dicluster domain-containing protein [Anaerolineales bacterium]|nr:4Fe-4S dicluster domain-containing protein [Anaerolineales bacterium]